VRWRGSAGERALADLTGRVALATCAEVPELDEDGPALLRALAGRGVEATPRIWDAPDVNWDRFELVVLRSTWDYAERLDAFLAWAARLPRVLNPLPVINWNTDKRYLGELADAGVPVVPSRFLEPGDPFDPPDDRFVIKPAVSAGGRRSASYHATEHLAADEHVRRLQAQGRRVLVQPYVEGVDSFGETALLFVNGGFSHAVRKGALLTDGRPSGEALYLAETIEAVEATALERDLADAALSALPFDASELLYARVDVLPGSEGAPLLLELELTEPSLYLGYAEGAARRLADGIAAALK
jgi:glutathione synthase/RimK-type ligase-like ATP-grasp enzyme